MARLLWPRRHCVVVDGKVAVATQALLVRHWKLILPLEKGNEVSPSMRRRGENLWEETNGTFVGGHKFLTSRSSVVHTNCVHICASVRSLSSCHFVLQVHLRSSQVAPPRVTDQV